MAEETPAGARGGEGGSIRAERQLCPTSGGAGKLGPNHLDKEDCFWKSGVAPLPGPLPLLRSGARGTGAAEGAELTGLAVLGGRRPPLQAAATAVLPAKDQYREAPSARSMTLLQQPSIFRKHDNIFKNNV